MDIDSPPSPCPPVRALAFDLDGTLVDSAPDIGHALNSALQQEGLSAFDIERVRSWIGDGPDVLIERALCAAGRPEDSALQVRLRRGFDAFTFQHPLQHGHVYDGIDALLAQLRPEWPMVVVTNKPTPLARAVLDAAGLLSYFSAVYGADTAELRKPAPNMLQRAAQELGFQTGDLLMVGDSGADLRAALAAGAASAWAEWGYADATLLPVQPRWRLTHPSQLWPIVQGFSAAAGR